MSAEWVSLMECRWVQCRCRTQVENCTVPLQDGGKGSRKGSGYSSGDKFQQRLRPLAANKQRGLMLS